jgi:hypothetical protein
MSRLSGVFLAAPDALKDDQSLGPGIDLALAGHLLFRCWLCLFDLARRGAARYTCATLGLSVQRVS